MSEQQLGIRDSIALLKRHTEVYQSESNMMLANQSIGGQEGVQATELEQMARLFRERLFDIEDQRRQIRLRTQRLQKRLLRVSKALLELNVKAEAPPTITVEVKSSTSFLGGNKTVERTWKTTLRNTNDYPVDLIVEDQYPIAKEDDIKVVQLGHDGGKLDEETGKVTWSFTLPAGQTAERVLKYAVRYPKKRRLLVD